MRNRSFNFPNLSFSSSKVWGWISLNTLSPFCFRVINYNSLPILRNLDIINLNTLKFMQNFTFKIFLPDMFLNCNICTFSNPLIVPRPINYFYSPLIHIFSRELLVLSSILASSSLRISTPQLTLFLTLPSFFKCPFIQ